MIMKVLLGMRILMLSRDSLIGNIHLIWHSVARYPSTVVVKNQQFVEGYSLAVKSCIKSQLD